MENECEALPGVAYPGVRDNRSTLNTKTGFDDDDVILSMCLVTDISATVLIVLSRLDRGIQSAMEMLHLKMEWFVRNSFN